MGGRSLTSAYTSIIKATYLGVNKESIQLLPPQCLVTKKVFIHWGCSLTRSPVPNYGTLCTEYEHHRKSFSDDPARQK